MTLRSLDHFLILVRDLDAAASTYTRLGFHVRPIAQHEEIKSANCVIHFADTYLELIYTEGASSEVMAPYQKRLQLGEGFVHLCLTSEKLAPDRERMMQVGVQTGPIMSARRRITLPDGSAAETASRCFYLWRDDNPYLSIFYADHPKPELIFIPEYAQHANTATGVSRVVYMSKDPGADADYFSTLFGATPDTVDAGGFTITDGRGDITEVLTESSARERYGNNMAVQQSDPLPGVGVALHYNVASLDTCAALLEKNRVVFEQGDGSITVPADKARGCIAVFEQGAAS